MRYISSAEIRTNPALLWKDGEEKETIITVNGKPKVLALAFSGDPDDLMSLVRRLRAERAIEMMWQASEEKGNNHMTMEEIDTEIAAARNDTSHA